MTGKKDDRKDGEALWREAVCDVTPLRKDAGIPSFGKCVPDFRPRQTHTPPLASVRPQESAVLNPGLDRRTAEKLRRGKIPIEARLDLHGYSRVQAYEALGQFVLDAYGAGMRCVLVITGKSGGVLRAGVPEWLDEPDLRALILKTAPARPEHGGEGALYILLRRKR